MIGDQKMGTPPASALHSLLADDRRWMALALAEAETAAAEGEVPVGAVVVRAGEVVGRGRNAVERLGDPTAHAEIVALRAACVAIGNKYLEGCTLYVTLEPCPMCAGALVWAKLPRLVFGAFDERAGACGTRYDVTAGGRMNHRIDVVSGVGAEAAGALLRAFFAARRG